MKEVQESRFDGVSNGKDMEINVNGVVRSKPGIVKNRYR